MNKETFKNNLRKKLINTINKIRLKRYYIEKSKSGKTYMAVILDKVIFRLFIFAAIIFLFYFISNSFVFSLLISLQIFALYNLIAYKISKIRMRNRISSVNHDVVFSKTLKELLNHTPNDFLEYLINILEKYGFESITKVDGRDIDIIGTIYGNKIGIKCLQYDKDYKVGVDNIRDFFISLRRMELTKGAIITTSAFSQDADSLVIKLKKYVHIQLVDMNGLLEIMKIANLYPSEKEIKKLILNEISDNRIDFKSYKDVVLSKGKIIKYIFLGLVMIVFGRFTPYSTYYNIIAVVIFCLAIISLIVLIFDLFKVNEKKQEDNVL